MTDAERRERAEALKVSVRETMSANFERGGTGTLSEKAFARDFPQVIAALVTELGIT